MSLILPELRPQTAEDWVIRQREPFLIITLRSARGEVTITRRDDYVGYKLLDGVEGLGVAPVRYESTPRPTHGAVKRHVSLDEAEIHLPLALVAPTQGDISELAQKLIEVIAPGEDVLTEIEVYAPSRGESRSRFGYYTEGLEGRLGGSDSHYQWRHLALTFTCPDPWWYGEQRSEEWVLTTKAKPFVSETVPFFPVILGDTVIQGVRHFSINGDAPAEPVWTITGPGLNPVLECQSCGKRLDFSGSAGTTNFRVTEPITIDTRTGYRTISTPTQKHGELWDMLTLDSQMFSLQTGANAVRLAMVEAGAQAKVHMAYRERWKAGF